MRNIAEK
jgi:hypothetical protein